MNEHLAGSTNLLRVDHLAPTKTTSNSKESVIASRLRTVTNVSIDLDVSISWNERRIIRARMQYYASPAREVKE